jgi:hypothetical protein
VPASDWFGNSIQIVLTGNSLFLLDLTHGPPNLCHSQLLLPHLILATPQCLPQFEDMFALPVIKGHTALGLGQANRHFSVVWHSCTGCLGILVKAKAPTPQDTVHILPGPGRDMGLGGQMGRCADQPGWGL